MHLEEMYQEEVLARSPKLWLWSKWFAWCVHVNSSIVRCLWLRIVEFKSEHKWQQIQDWHKWHHWQDGSLKFKLDWTIKCANETQWNGMYLLNVWIFFFVDEWSLKMRWSSMFRQNIDFCMCYHYQHHHQRLYPLEKYVFWTLQAI